jgi:nickel-dependent lactate racemase
MDIIKFIENMLYNKNKNKMPDEIFAGFIVKIYNKELEELKKINDNTEESLLNKKRLEISIEALTNYYEVE